MHSAHNLKPSVICLTPARSNPYTRFKVNPPYAWKDAVLNCESMRLAVGAQEGGGAGGLVLRGRTRGPVESAAVRAAPGAPAGAAHAAALPPQRAATPLVRAQCRPSSTRRLKLDLVLLLSASQCHQLHLIAPDRRKPCNFSSSGSRTTSVHSAFVCLVCTRWERVLPALTALFDDAQGQGAADGDRLRDQRAVHPVVVLRGAAARADRHRGGAQRDAGLALPHPVPAASKLRRRSRDGALRCLVSILIFQRLDQAGHSICRQVGCILFTSWLLLLLVHEAL